MNGCHNRQPFKTDQLMQDGWIYTQGGHTRVPRMVRVPFRMSQDCQFQRDPMNYGQQDKACTGCKHKEAHESR